MTEDEMVGWHHWLDGHEFEQALGIGDRQRSLACCSPWGRKELDTTERLNWTEWFSGKESTWQCRRQGFDPWVWKIRWRRNGNPLQDSCLDKPMDRRDWQATVHGVAKKWDMTEWLNSNNSRHNVEQQISRASSSLLTGTFYLCKLSRWVLLLSHFSHVRLCVTP